jgi:2-dehydro-3-deoxyphosphogalactonate aldolase
VPGVATLTEAFAALKAGASDLKLFPGEALGPDIVKAWRAVLPKGSTLPDWLRHPERIAPYQRAGASGFGIGSALYRPGTSVEEVARRAEAREGLERGQAKRGD